MNTYEVGLVYHSHESNQVPFQTTVICAPNERDALNHAVSVLKPNHMQTLIVRLIPPKK